MSHHLFDFSQKAIDFDFDNLIIGRKVKMDEDSAKYYLYYHKSQISDITPKEIYIRLPTLRLIYGLSNYKYNQLNIPIYPNWEGTKKFIDFIIKLESDIEHCFLEKNINKIFVSLVNKKSGLSFIKVYIHDKIKITSNINNQEIKLNEFKINGEIDMVLKLSYIWTRDNKIGLSAQIYQIKYLAPPEQLDINFIDPITPIIKPPIIMHKIPPKLGSIPKIGTSMLPPQIKTNIPPVKNNLIINTDDSTIEDNMASDKKFVPTVHDLQNAIKKLKSVND